MNVQRKDDPLRAAQLQMTDMLVVIDKICKEHNIEYWLSDGTLLGAIRHEGFIPWDDDADISMMRDDYERFCNVVENVLPAPYKLQSKMNNTHGLHNWCKIMYMDDFEWTDWHGKRTKGLSIDVFPFDYVSDAESISTAAKYLNRIASIRSPLKVNSVKSLLQWTINSLKLHRFKTKTAKKTNTVTYGIETSYYGWCYLKVDEIFPLTRCEFEGFELSIPANADKCLTREYGDYMQLPNSEDRETHMKDLTFSSIQ